MIPSKGDGPFAVLLRHGWTVSGPLIPEPSQPPERKVNVNRITIREIQSIKEIVTPKLILDALAIDFNEYGTVSTDSSGKGYSREDELFMQKAEKGIGSATVIMKFLCRSETRTSSCQTTRNKP